MKTLEKLKKEKEDAWAAVYAAAARGDYSPAHDDAAWDTTIAYNAAFAADYAAWVNHNEKLKELER
jgi:hypothetical protein